MSTETLNFPRETTMQRIATALERQSAMVQVLAQDSLSTLVTSWADIQRLVREGLGPTVFHIGDQLTTKWKDVAANVEYDYTFDVVHFGPVTLEDGEVVPGMYLEAHWATPFDINFDTYEAMYVPAETLAAGTYNFTIVSTWSKATAGTYQFTLTNPVPAGGHVAGLQRIADTDPSTWTVSTYADGASQTAIETVPVTKGSAGTSLGNLIPAGTDSLNSIQRLGYGYNNYKQSAVRQWLNSEKAAGQWWASQNKYDRAPAYATTKAGYAAGFPADFLAVLAKTKISVATNTVTDGGITDVMYDKFFLPSLEEEYWVPMAAGVEGPVWEYWPRAKGLTAPQTRGGDYKNPGAIRYRVSNHTSAVYLWHRSAYRSYACYECYVGPTGYSNNSNAYNSYAVAPACIIA